MQKVTKQKNKRGSQCGGIKPCKALCRHRTEISRSGTRMTESRLDAYGYNDRNELVSATKTGGAQSSATEYEYAYDDIGNRLASLDLGTNRTYTANSLNQYVNIAEGVNDFTPQFDLDGNQTLVRTTTGDWSVTYNAENRPVNWSCGDKNIEMLFDRMGRRVEYIETVSGITNAHHRFVYDGYLCVQRLNALSGNAIDLAFAWDPTEPVATRPITMQRQGGWNFFYTHDGNKNVSDVVSFQQARGIAAHYEYAPFGAVTAATRNTNITAFDVRFLNPFRFSSEYADDALGLVYYNYRHYEPVTGRWLSRDIVSSHGMYVFCDNSYMDFDILGLYRMISGGFSERYHGSVSARYRLIMEIAYLNSLPCYTVCLKDLEYADVSEINANSQRDNTEVIIVAHGDLSVEGYPYPYSWRGPKQPFYSGVKKDPNLRFVLNNGHYINLSEIKVADENLFGCYISPEVRGAYKDGEYSWEPDEYSSMYPKILSRLKELTPTDNCERKTIYIYEGEWSNVRLSKEKLKENGTDHWFGMWGRVNYDIAKRERNSPLVQ